jgi:3,4-dihydroxy-2-butanone 4-phosphate synthase
MLRCVDYEMLNIELFGRDGAIMHRFTLWVSPREAITGITDADRALTIVKKGEAVARLFVDRVVVLRGHGRECRTEHENGLNVLVLAAVNLEGRDIKLMIL